MIQSLKPNQVFVFGSNLAGNHIRGAAYQAYKNFGAEMGIGEGMTGNCYAFPTLTAEYQKRDDEDLEISVSNLIRCARKNPDKEFLLTKIGTGIAGYSEEYMNELLRDLPSNVIRV